VKKKQAEYFENFPPKEMNVKIEDVSQSSTSDDHVRRALISTKDFAPGDIIFFEQAIASAFDPSLEVCIFLRCKFNTLYMKMHTIKKSGNIKTPIY